MISKTDMKCSSVGERDVYVSKKMGNISKAEEQKIKCAWTMKIFRVQPMCKLKGTFNTILAHDICNYFYDNTQY